MCSNEQWDSLGSWLSKSIDNTITYASAEAPSKVLISVIITRRNSYGDGYMEISGSFHSIPFFFILSVFQGAQGAAGHPACPFNLYNNPVRYVTLTDRVTRPESRRELHGWVRISICLSSVLVMVTHWIVYMEELASYYILSSIQRRTQLPACHFLWCVHVSLDKTDCFPGPTKCWGEFDHFPIASDFWPVWECGKVLLTTWQPTRLFSEFPLFPFPLLFSPARNTILSPMGKVMLMSLRLLQHY